MSRIAAPLVLLAACTGGPPSVSELVDRLGPLHTSEQSCLLAACDGVETDQELAACRQERCAYESEQWSLRPTAIRHSEDTFFVQAALGFEPGRYGFVQAQRPREAYVGVTVVTSTGAEIDLAVTTVFADQLGQPFTLSTDVGPDVRDVIFGVWDRKIAPCDSERSGCKEFGFLLDGPLATWPPTVYDDGTRQRIPPATVDVTVLDAGAGPNLVARRDKLLESLRAELAVFGAEIGTITTRRHERASPGTQILIADDHDLLIARSMGAALDPKPAAVPEPSAETPFVIKLGGRNFDASAPCAALADADYEACLSEPRD